jgi:hypothetical protein
MPRPTEDERKILEQWLKLPRVRQIFRMDPESIEKIYTTIKSRKVGKFTSGGSGFSYEFTVPESVRDISISNLNATLEGYVERDDWTMVRKSPARVAREEKERKDRAIAIELERQKTDPVFQARLKAEQEKAKAEAKAIADAAAKAYWTERAQKQPGENSLQCLQRYRRERVLAGKETESSFAHPANILTPVVPAGIATPEPGAPTTGVWSINDALVATAKARNRG